MLEEQLRHKDDSAEVERRIFAVCREVSERLDNLDYEGKRATFAAFSTKVEATRDDMSMTVAVDPKVTTIGQTLGYSSNSKYSFVIVELEEVVVQKMPRVVEFVPVDRGGDL